jgi:hypothetical protein
MRQDAHQNPRRQVVGNTPAQMVAPLKQKPASVEIKQARDEPAQFPIIR